MISTSLALKCTLLFIAAAAIAACGRYELDSTQLPFQSSQYQKLNQKGELIAIKSGPWHCVTDTATGLTWEIKSNDEKLHHNKSTYSYTGAHKNDQAASSLRAISAGSCNERTTERCTTTGFINSANKKALCGFDDWRLPTAEELQTILDLSRPMPGPLVCPCLFPQTYRSAYWTSNFDQVNNVVKTVNFSNGSIVEMPPTTFLSVRLVRKE